MDEQPFNPYELDEDPSPEGPVQSAAPVQAPPTIGPASFRCTQCGYDLSGSALGGQCPECGKPVSESVRGRARTDSCGRAVTVMVLGIVALATCGPLGIVAIAMYPGAKRAVIEGGYSGASLTMARAGLITGIIATAITAIWVLIFAAGGLANL